MEKTATHCPRCGSEDVVPILYGMPTEEAVEASVRGEIALGGAWSGPRLLSTLAETAAMSGAKTTSSTIALCAGVL